MYLPYTEEHSTSHLQCKHFGTFANRKYEEVSYTKDQKMCYPILKIVLKMQPHYSHYRRQKTTPSSGTSPLASYKEVSGRERACNSSIVFDLARDLF